MSALILQVWVIHREGRHYLVTHGPFEEGRFRTYPVTDRTRVGLVIATRDDIVADLARSRS